METKDIPPATQPLDGVLASNTAEPLPTPGAKGMFLRPKYLILTLVLMVIFILAIVILILRSKSAETGPATIILPTPTSVRKLSPVATLSSYLRLEATVSAISEILTNVSGQEQILLPPTVELSLDL